MTSRYSFAKMLGRRCPISAFFWQKWDQLNSVARALFALRLALPLLLLLSFPGLVSGETSKPSAKLSGDQRQQIIRAFLAERAFAHRALPRGKAGVVIESGNVSPSEAEALQLGTAARPGERVQITGVRFLREGILFEINGGAVKHEKWSERIHVGMGGPDLRSGGQPDGKPSPEQVSPVPTGASVLLKLEDSAGITAERVKDLLAPVLDFRSVSQAEAYQKNLSPVLAAALKDHRALVGMDRDMVLSAMGRPPRRLRETSNGREYEEWIYGTPPEEVQFVRFLHGKVVRIEQMKVTGEKLVRTLDEVGRLDGMLDASTPASTPKTDAGDFAPVVAAPAMAAPAEVESKELPTLLRPGEVHPSKPTTGLPGTPGPQPAQK